MKQPKTIEFITGKTEEDYINIPIKNKPSKREETVLFRIIKRNNCPIFNINYSKLCSRYFIRGNMVVCILTIDGNVVGLGVSKRHPNDKFKVGIGVDIAFSRAVYDLFDIEKNKKNELKM